jgi:23S rRNA pseudouridine1911/1915/1917 synthase
VPPIVFVVDRRETGQTLAAVLKKRFGLSWSQAKRLVERRHVRVGGQVETDVARRLKPGRKVQLDTGTVEQKATGDRRQGTVQKSDVRSQKSGHKGKPPVSRESRRSADERGRQPAAAPGIDIVYSDEAVVVANKPAGLTTMRHAEEAAEFGERGKRFLTKTLADVLPKVLGEPNRPVIAVHRIDRDTSGLVVFARTTAAAEELSRQFRKHTVDRRYLALTRGTPKPGRIESVVVRDRGDGRRGSTTEPDAADGKRSVTHVKVLEELGAFALVECRLETGRTHQVRIHLGESGTPLCGERVYDRPVNGRPVPDRSGATRPMLHAARLGFRHPEAGREMTWDVKPPEDFSALWVKLREGRPPG